MSQPSKKRKLDGTLTKSAKDQKTSKLDEKPANVELKATSPIPTAETGEKTFEDLGIIPELVQACTALGFKNPRPIQVESIPLALAGRDVIGLAETGSGKTAAFGLPMLQGMAIYPFGK